MFNLICNVVQFSRLARDYRLKLKKFENRIYDTTRKEVCHFGANQLAVLNAYHEQIVQ